MAIIPIADNNIVFTKLIEIAYLRFDNDNLITPCPIGLHVSNVDNGAQLTTLNLGGKKGFSFLPDCHFMLMKIVASLFYKL